MYNGDGEKDHIKETQREIFFANFTPIPSLAKYLNHYLG